MVDEENATRAAHELALQWYRMATDIPNSAFKLWALATLKSRLSFDGAIWGRWVKPNSVDSARVVGSYLHRLPADAVDACRLLWAENAPAQAAPGRTMRASLTEPQWAGQGDDTLRERCLRQGVAHALALRSTDTGHSSQFVLLSRTASTGPFEVSEAEWFEFVGPHLMQAYATSTKALVHGRAVSAAPPVTGAALVDRSGVVHENDEGFALLMRREWSDWKGMQLPAVLMHVIVRRGQERWRFLGQQLAATFTPLQDLLLVSVRPRGAEDSLTPRELQVARQYASGRSFREIAVALHLAPATVRAHLRKVFLKLRVNNKTRLAVLLRNHD